MAKSKWETNVKDKLILVEGWARNGLTDEQIAKNLGIGYSTLKEYKKKYPAFLAALKKGKEVIDFEVENALLKKALGFKERVQKAFKIKNVEYDNGKRVRETEEVILVDEEQYTPPDTTAQIFWLKNRKPEEWRDKRDVEHSGNLSNEVNITIDGEDYGD
ncbi:transposase [Clostridium tetani]|uniref:transposase n=1 Tax=Clostridium tetani TaxID=1513 RepID=UPI00100C27CD|nr:transposase [Clostridium tetani]RXI46276.1 transposase [Clostridium tetani]RXM61800.1 transposase [Clostridium tetani]RXM67582.1 transposase [Clostridium tetani]